MAGATPARRCSLHRAHLRLGSRTVPQAGGFRRCGHQLIHVCGEGREALVHLVHHQHLEGTECGRGEGGVTRARRG